MTKKFNLLALVFLSISVFFTAKLEVKLSNELMNVGNNEVHIKEKCATNESGKVESNNEVVETRYFGPNLDPYEPNNILDKAHDLSPVDYFLKEDYSNSINAIMHTDWGISDADLYYFKILSESEVNISITSTNVQYNYEFIIMDSHYKTFDSVKSLARYNDNIYEDITTNANKTYSGVLQAGTYYIYLRELISSERTDESSSTTYTLTLSVDKTDNCENASIADLRFNKQLDGAVWVADFLPLGSENLFTPAIDAIYQVNTSIAGSSGIYILDPTLEDMRRLSGGNQIASTIYYVWGKELKDVLYEAFKYLTEDVLTEVRNKEATRIELQAQLDNTGKCITFLTNLFRGTSKLSLVTKTIALSINIAGKVSLSFLTSMINELMPEIGINDVRLGTYFGIMSGILNNSSVNEVIQIPVYYRLYSNNNGKHYKISYLPTLDFCDFFYYSDTISAVNGNIYFGRGKIYGIKGAILDGVVNLPLASNYQKIEPDVIELTVHPYDDYKYDELQYREYKWFKFEATQSGTYTFYSSFNGNGNQMRLDVFNQLIYGYDLSVENPLDKVIGGYESTTTTQEGVYYTKNLSNGETIYLRISGDEQKLDYLYDFRAYFGVLPNDFGETTTEPEENICKHNNLSEFSIAGPDGWYKKCLDCNGLIK